MIVSEPYNRVEEVGSLSLLWPNAWIAIVYRYIVMESEMEKVLKHSTGALLVQRKSLIDICVSICIIVLR